MVSIRFRDGELLASHIDPTAFAYLTDELSQRIDVAATAAAEIEHTRALTQWGADEATDILALNHVSLNTGEGCLSPYRNGGWFATRPRFQHIRPSSHLSVLGLA